MTTPIKPIEKGLFHTPFWLAPAADVFAQRSVRFQELAEAEGSQWRDYLALLGKLAAAQQAVAAKHAFALPPTHQGRTVLPEAALGDVPADFYLVLADLLAEIGTQAPANVQAELNTLAALPREAAEALASRVLTGNSAPEEQAAVVWVQAALQIIWTAWAAQACFA